MAAGMVLCAASPAQAQKQTCPDCVFTLELPKDAPAKLEVSRSTDTLTIKTAGFELEAKTFEGKFDALASEFQTWQYWKTQIKSYDHEFQEKRRGTFRGAPCVSGAATFKTRAGSVWVAWIVYDNPNGQLTTLVYTLDGNPSDKKLLKFYEDLTGSLRWKKGPKAQKQAAKADK